jgi:hypothetical protein
MRRARGFANDNSKHLLRRVNDPRLFAEKLQIFRPGVAKDGHSRHN